jgi:hypothetical protein
MFIISYYRYLIVKIRTSITKVKCREAAASHPLTLTELAEDERLPPTGFAPAVFKTAAFEF